MEVIKKLLNEQLVFAELFKEQPFMIILCINHCHKFIWTNQIFLKKKKKKDVSQFAYRYFTLYSDWLKSFMIYRVCFQLQHHSMFLTFSVPNVQLIVIPDLRPIHSTKGSAIWLFKEKLPNQLRIFAYLTHWINKDCNFKATLEK